MTRNFVLKLAASTLAIGITIAAYPAAQAMRPAADPAARAEKQAADAAARAHAEAARGRFAEATRFAEQAVTASPRDAGYRMLLADLYLKSGRYQSAATTYGDVLALNPGNSRASLTLALCDAAQGRNAAAVAVLDAIADTAPQADVGLAYALAGETRRAIALLEPAAHAPGASGRIRQNLAFAYALAGDWEKARVTAAQDVSPADLRPRLAQWAALAKPASSYDQVAALLNIRPVADSGQPEQLALAPTASPVALASAEPAPAPVQPAAAPAPEPAPAPAAAEPAAAPLPAAQAPAAAVAATVAAAEDPKPQPREDTRPLYADAVQSLVAPQPAVLRTGHAAKPRLAGFELPHAATPRRSTDSGRYAVQLGAFSSTAAVERAWGQVMKRYGFASMTPFSTTIDVAGKGTLHRLSVAGFGSRAEADRTCRAVRAKGGACFVRAVAGDAPAPWGSRYASR